MLHSHAGVVSGGDAVSVVADFDAVDAVVLQLYLNDRGVGVQGVLYQLNMYNKERRNKLDPRDISHTIINYINDTLLVLNRLLTYEPL